METVTLVVQGMTCAACSARVERALKKTNGVISAAVNLATERASVEYDAGVLRLTGIKAAIENAGYKPVDLSKNAGAEQDKNREKAYKSLKFRLIISAIFSFPLLYIAMAPMISWLPFYKTLSVFMMRNAAVYAALQLALVIPVIGSGCMFYIHGFRNLFRLSPNMDSLIALGTSAAFFYSLYNTAAIFSGNHHTVESLYFETSGVIITLILLGKTLEARCKGRTGEAIKKLMDLAPKTAILIITGGVNDVNDVNDVIDVNDNRTVTEKEIPLEEVVRGDLLLVKPGSGIPADGIVVEGISAIDESMLSGESIPVDKKPGDSVYAATVNTNGLLKIRAEKTGSETALANIIRLTEDAQGSKAPIARLADIVSGYFVPVVAIIALAAGAAWFIAASAGLVTLPAGSTALEFSLSITISVLVIACPCALGLATPTAIMAGTGKGAEKGILIKSGEALETACRISVMVLDKTGTITEGKPTVTGIIVKGEVSPPASAGADAPSSAAPLCPEALSLLRICASAEKNSEHPLASAIVREAEKNSLAALPVSDFKALPGLGIEAVVHADTPVAIIAGNQKLMEENNVPLLELETHSNKLAGEGKTPVYISLNGKAAGIIAIADVLKPSGKKAIENLYQMGIEPIMLTGDNQRTAAAIANEAGISKYLAEVLPEDKSNEIKKLQAETFVNKKSGVRRNTKRIVAMAGDGINDAPALAQADIGIAIGAGTDIAIESADIVLMRSDLTDLAACITLSKRTMRTIKQNLFWAFGYNVLGIPIAAGLLYFFGGPLLNPIFAAAAMSMSSVSVLLNALRLKTAKI